MEQVQDAPEHVDGQTGDNIMGWKWEGLWRCVAMLEGHKMKGQHSMSANQSGRYLIWLFGGCVGVGPLRIVMDTQAPT
jgi:hypothetical protein